MSHSPPAIEVQGLELGYGLRVVLREVDFTVRRGEIFVIMGGSGCGKSTLLRSMIGLLPPRRGHIRYHQTELYGPDGPDSRLMRRFGVLFQTGALWSSMTLAENVALPLSQWTGLSVPEIDRTVQHLLALVGLRGFEHHLPAELSGGMRKRAALARAMALRPDFLFLDEPSAGLDPVSSRRLDELMIQLRDALGTTLVVVTHELESIFTIADRALFLDATQQRPTALGPPRRLLKDSTDPALQAFLNRKPELVAGENRPASPDTATP